MASISDPEFDQVLTLRQSFHVLCAFLEQFNSRGSQETDSLESWVRLEPDGTSFDPAQLSDYLKSAREVLARGA
jgi:hypothetical protein